MTGVPFDASALTQPVDRKAAREFTRQLQERGLVPRITAFGVVLSVIGAAIGAVAVLFALSTLFVTLARVAEGGSAGALLAVVPFVLFAAVVVVLVVSAVRGGGRGQRWLRLDRFARANGMTYRPTLPAPGLPGMIFHRGSSREASDLVRGEQPRFVEFANYRFVTGSGKNRTTHRWGYVAIKLDVPLPHIVLDATGNNALFGSNLPAVYDRDQRLSLEGDFDEHFALYCPKDYETDALYLFTPDIMARFIDNAAELDVEIVDDWLFLYAKRDLSTLDPATWAWLFSVVAALLDKLAQWARWRDDELAATPMAAGAAAPATAPMLTPPPGVAARGRRLKSGVPWGTFVVFGIFLVGWTFLVTGGWGLLPS